MLPCIKYFLEKWMWHWCWDPIYRFQTELMSFYYMILRSIYMYIYVCNRSLFLEVFFIFNHPWPFESYLDQSCSIWIYSTLAFFLHDFSLWFVVHHCLFFSIRTSIIWKFKNWKRYSSSSFHWYVHCLSLFVLQSFEI